MQSWRASAKSLVRKRSPDNVGKRVETPGGWKAVVRPLSSDRRRPPEKLLENKWFQVLEEDKGILFITEVINLIDIKELKKKKATKKKVDFNSLKIKNKECKTLALKSLASFMAG